MTDWDGTFALQYYYDKIARDAALGGKMKLTNEQAMELQHNIMDTALAIVALKRKDYSGDDDPFANFRRSTMFGVKPWLGCMVRLTDKLSRIYQITKSGAMFVKDESLMDAFCDTVNYVCILAGLVCEELGLQEEWLDKESSVGIKDIVEEDRWIPPGHLKGEVPYAGGGEDYDGEGTS